MQIKIDSFNVAIQNVVLNNISDTILIALSNSLLGIEIGEALEKKLMSDMDIKTMKSNPSSRA